MPCVDRRNRARGFTLVELMIALVLGLIVAGGATALFVSQRVANKQSSGMATVQSEGRIALDALVRDIRGAGDYGCWPVGVHTQAVADKTRFFPDDGGIYVFYRGTVPSSLGVNSSGKKLLPMLGAAEVAGFALDPDSDVVAVRGVYGMLSALQADMASPTDVLNVAVPSSGQDIRTGDALVVTDCRNSAIFEVTGGPMSGLLHGVATNTGKMGNGNSQPGLGAKYNAGSVIGRLDVVWWFVATIDGKRGLYRLSARDITLASAGTVVRPALVSDAVQTLHLAFTYNTQMDSGQPEALATGSADDINASIAAGTLSKSWSSARTVTVNMLTRSTSNGNAGPVPYTFEGVVKTPTDNKLYLPLSTTTHVRNTL